MNVPQARKGLRAERRTISQRSPGGERGRRWSKGIRPAQLGAGAGRSAGYLPNPVRPTDGDGTRSASAGRRPSARRLEAEAAWFNTDAGRRAPLLLGQAGLRRADELIEHFNGLCRPPLRAARRGCPASTRPRRGRSPRQRPDPRGRRCGSGDVEADLFAVCWKKSRPGWMLCCNVSRRPRGQQRRAAQASASWITSTSTPSRRRGEARRAARAPRRVPAGLGRRADDASSATWPGARVTNIPSARAAGRPARDAFNAPMIWSAQRQRRRMFAPAMPGHPRRTVTSALQRLVLLGRAHQYER